MIDGLNDQFIKAFRIIERNMATLYDDYSGGWRQSRKIEGMYTPNGERQGFRNIYIYVERGLGDKFAIIAEIVTRIIRYHRMHGHTDGRIILLSFGGQEDDLGLYHGIYRAHRVDNAGDVAEELCKISGMTGVNGDFSVIRNLFPLKIHLDYVGVSPPGAEDLVCFIKSPKELRMSQETRVRYRRLLKSRSIWVVLDGDDVKIEASMDPMELEEIE